jgi:YVTN family beta-propeller protein
MPRRTHLPVFPPRRVLIWIVGLCGLLAAACGSDTGTELVAPTTTDGTITSTVPDASTTSGPGPTATAPATTLGPTIDVVDGMPPVVDPANLYSEIDTLSDATAGALERVYVPNEVSGTVTVIDPATFEVVDTFPSGFIPQHVVPAYDLRTLYTLNSSGNTIVPIDPMTGRPGAAIAVEDPYNLYFLPDGSEAIVVAEAHQRLDFVDPVTFERHSSLQTDCAGLNHLDFSIDGRFAVATCEFDGRIIKVDLASRTVVASLAIDISQSGKVDPIKSIAQPQDVRISPDGSTFYIADLITDGVYLIDGATFTQRGFVHTGVAAHGLYPSRDGTKLFVVNRGTNHIPPPASFHGQAQGGVAVIDFATAEVTDYWPVPGAGSPDMGNLNADGTQLWLAGRYDAEVYVFDTTTGEVLARIPVGENPHGLTVWPQPGRVSLGHTGNMR